MQDVERARDPHPDMMQTRAGSVGEGEVMNVALAVYPHCPELRRIVLGLGIFGEAEAETRVEVVRSLHVGREAIEVVDALDARAAVRRIALQHRGRLLHAEIEIERHPEGVGRSQRAALMWQVGEGDRQVLRPEPGRGALDVIMARELESE